MQIEDYLTKLYHACQPIKLQEGLKIPMKGEIVAKTNNHRCGLDDWLSHNGNYGIRTGEVGDGFEVIDFDPKNYGEKESFDPEEIIKNSATLMHEFKTLIKEQDGGKELLQLIPIIRTPSGGYHLYFKSNHCGGNQKLALNEDRGAFIETRGQGGYVACAPTPGYEILQNDVLKIARIDLQQRAMLLDTAKCLTRYFNDHLHVNEGINIENNADSPFVAANLDADAFLAQLEHDGWTTHSNKGDQTWLRRPGKDKGYSAIFNLYPSSQSKYPFFYNFSSTAEIEPNKRLTFSDYLLETEFAGDKKNLVLELIKRGYGKDRLASAQNLHTTEQLPIESDDFWTEIQKFAVDQDTIVPEEPPVLYMKDQLFLTEGNLAGVAGVQKTGKSALANVIMSKLINPNIEDFPSIKVTPPNGKGVLLIDTEQSRTKQKQNVVSWILKRAKTPKLPKNFKVINFRSFSITQSKDNLSLLMKSMKEKFNGLHLVIVDGGADFVSTVNNLEEVTAFMKLLSELCTVYECAILLNIHTNPSSIHTGDHKPTGHLGSSLLKKCESVVLIHSDQHNKALSIITALALRNGNRDEFGELFYKYDKEKGYHMEIVDEEAKELHIENKNLTLLANVQRIAMGSEMNDAMLDLMTEFDWSAPQARKKIRECINLKFLKVDGDKLIKTSKINTNDDINLDDLPF